MQASNPVNFRSVLSVFIVALIILSGWILYANFQKVSAQEGWVRHTYEVITELETILSAAKDTESGVRGYILTKNPEYLAPAEESKIIINEHFEKFKTMTKDSPDQQAAAVVLRKMIDERIKILDEARAVFDRGQMSPQKLTEMGNRGTATIIALREQTQKMKDFENRLLSQRNIQAERSRDYFVWAVILTTFVSSIAVTFAFLQFVGQQRRLEEEARAQAKEADLKQTIAEAARLTAGNVSLKVVAENVARMFSEKFGILASRTFLNENGRLKVINEMGCEVKEETAANRGLISEALVKESVWQISDIPEDHWKIESSMGKSTPKALVFIPIRFQGLNIGLIECACFKVLTDEQIYNLNTISETVGVGFNASYSRQTLQDLLEKTQLQSEELQTQQEELRANNEELEQQTRALESQQEAMSVKNHELENLSFELERKADEVKRSSQYKSDFLAKMSHELRTPLNGLLILSTLLMENKERNLNDRQLQFAKSIYGAGNDLLTLVNDILDLSKIEAQKLNLRPEAFKLRDLLEHKEVTFGPQMETKKLQFSVKVDRALSDLSVFTDRQRLEQILRNFISNAIKFTERGAIALEAKPAATEGFVEISVADTGIGIPKNKQELIFEAFEQADSSTSRSFGGTGLGLTISKELAVLLGGSIRLNSEEGKGSTFTLTLPINLPTENGQRPRALAPSSPIVQAASSPEVEKKNLKESSAQALRVIAKVPKKAKTILIVEDDEKFRSSIIDAIKDYGFYPLEAADGEVALSILENHTPNAVLLDIKLPGISGLGILEIMKQMPQLRHVPVHMISALDYQRNALRRGALGYLTKPVTLEKVRSAVSRIQNFLDEKIKKVLVIEDDERQRDAISELISGSDVSVETAQSGREAVSRLKEENFDCIILDLTLPDISGFELLTNLNSLPIALPPIVIYTGKDISDEEEEYLRKFSESIIIKGARSPERLLDEVNLFLHRVESLLPEDKRAMLTQLRSQEQVFLGKTVLVADDDLRNVFALTSALESKGLKVVIAKNGLEAVDMVKGNREIDLVLMDIMMPKMDGYEAIQKIRGLHGPEFKELPIIALTAKAMREDHEKCIEAGANDYLPKPVNLDNLLTALKVWLSAKEGF